MKKVKLMLLSLSVLAVVGGALAFTVKTTDTFCTAATIKVNNVVTYPTFCPNTGKLKAGSGSDNIATALTNGDPLAPCSNVHCVATNPGSTIE